MTDYSGGPENNDYVLTLADGNSTVDGGGGIDSLTIDWADTTGRIYGLWTATDQAVYLIDALRVDFSNIERLTVLMGSGDDIFYVDGLHSPSVDGGDGYDEWVAEYGMATEALTLTPGEGSEYRLSNGVRLVNVEFIQIVSGSGDDVFTLREGNGELFGRGGNDRLTGGAGRDRLEGGDGDDILKGGGGNDLLVGGDGDDVLEGGDGDDYLVGAEGDDVIDGGAGFDWLSGGLGIDTLSYAHSATGVIVDLLMDSAMDSKRVEIDFINAFENVTGSAFDDWLSGTGDDNVLNGMAGADIMTGLTGDDEYWVDNAGDQVREDAGQGYDRVFSSIDYTLAANVEALTLIGSAHIDATGNGLDNMLTGNSGNNRLNGGAGADVMAGGAGNDVYYVDNARDVVIERPGAGTDTINSLVSYTLIGRHVETLRLLGSADLFAIGNSLANIVIGNAGNNVIRGGGGMDVLTGGAGRDIFGFDTALGADNVDRITDFTVADDTIRLSQAIFSAAGGPGRLAAGAFRIGAEAIDADDRILYDDVTGRLFYDADGNGAGAPILFAQIGAVLALTNADFHIL